MPTRNKSIGKIKKMHEDGEKTDTSCVKHMLWHVSSSIIRHGRQSLLKLASQNFQIVGIDL